MFDTVEYLKGSKFKSPDEIATRIAKLCEDNGIDILTLLRILIRSNRQKCTHNFIDDADFGICCDVDGYGVAFGLDNIAKAFNFDKEHVKCREVNEKGCCAKINCMVCNLEEGLYEYMESKKESSKAGGAETEG